jgi:hypothetical protein
MPVSAALPQYSNHLSLGTRRPRAVTRSSGVYVCSAAFGSLFLLRAGER